MNKSSDFPHDLLLEIMMLRKSKNQNAFMDKLYEATDGKFNLNSRKWIQGADIIREPFKRFFL